MSSIESNIRSLAQESDIRANQRLKARCDEIQSTIDQSNKVVDVELEGQRRALEELEKQLEVQKKERSVMGTRMKGDLGAISGTVPRDFVVRETGLKVSVENKFLDCQRTIKEQYSSLESEEKQIGAMSERLSRTENELGVERVELDKLHAELQSEVAALEKRLDLVLQTTRSALEEKKRSITKQLKDHDSDVSRHCDEIFRKISAKQVEVREAMDELRRDA